MEIKYRLKGTDGRAVTGVIHNTHPRVREVIINRVPAQEVVARQIVTGKSDLVIAVKDVDDQRATLSHPVEIEEDDASKGCRRRRNGR